MEMHACFRIAVASCLVLAADMAVADGPTEVETEIVKAGLTYLNKVRNNPTAMDEPGTPLDKYSQYRKICVDLAGHARQETPLRWSDDLYRLALEKAKFLAQVSPVKREMYMVHVPTAEELKGTGFESKAGWDIPGENLARSSGHKDKIIHGQAGEMFVRGWINDRHILAHPGHRYSLLGGKPGAGQSRQREFAMAVVPFRIPNNPDRPHLYYMAVAIVR